MNLPNFIIVGAQKCGTTSLYDLLENHPEVNMSTIKEVNFFNMEAKYSKGLSYYSKFFKKPLKGQKITGEASPGYMNSDGVAQRIKENLGQVKIIMMLRDPVKRAYSQYWDNRRHLAETLNDTDIISKYLTSSYNAASRGYFSRGVYIKYINEYLKYFKRENIHIIILEELIQNPEKNIKELYQFLGISENKESLKLPSASNASLVYNNPLYRYFLNNPRRTKFLNKHFRRFLFFGKKIPYKYSLPQSERLDEIYSFYKPYNQKLEMFLNKKVILWPDYSLKS